MEKSRKGMLPFMVLMVLLAVGAVLLWLYVINLTPVYVIPTVLLTVLIVCAVLWPAAALAWQYQFAKMVISVEGLREDEIASDAKYHVAFTPEARIVDMPLALDDGAAPRVSSGGHRFRVGVGSKLVTMTLSDPALEGAPTSDIRTWLRMYPLMRQLNRKLSSSASKPHDVS